ncbi:DUF4157 domain-containing protein [Streptomyces echinatus]|uniref:eCIS core domain-containing protein n=1 Tax=Streptomyces echinatus TaxID=67293 RepID=UPI003CD0B960
MRAVGKVLSGAGRPSRAAHAVLPTASGGNAMVARLLESGESSSAPGLDLAARITALRGGGKPLPAELRAEAESGFGTPLGDVHLHDDAEAAELASLLGARAFTSGNDIFFNSGEYNPSTPDGYELLAHELTHTLQQSAGPSQGRAVAPRAAGQRAAGPRRAGRVRHGTRAAGRTGVGGRGFGGRGGYGCGCEWGGGRRRGGRGAGGQPGRRAREYGDFGSSIRGCGGSAGGRRPRGGRAGGQRREFAARRPRPRLHRGRRESRGVRDPPATPCSRRSSEATRSRTGRCTPDPSNWSSPY